MSGSNMISNLSKFMLDRRGFIAASAAALLAGCKSENMTDVRVLFSDTPGTMALNMLRIFASALSKVGVNATIETVTRGAGKMAAQTLADGPRDGSMIAQLFSGLIYAEFGQDEPARNPLTSFEWIGNYSSDARILISSPASGITSFEQLMSRDKPMTLSANSTHGPGYTEASIIRHLTGARVTAVPGFSGGGRNLAVISGEVDGILGSVDGLSGLLDMPGMNILLLTSKADLPPGLAGMPRGGVPVLRDLARGPDAEPLLMLVEAYAQLGRMLALPPGTPQDILTLWRKRFAEVTADPEFRKEIGKRKMEVHYRSGERVTEQLAALQRQKPNLLPALHRALNS